MRSRDKRWLQWRVRKQVSDCGAIEVNKRVGHRFGNARRVPCICLHQAQASQVFFGQVLHSLIFTLPHRTSMNDTARFPGPEFSLTLGLPFPLFWILLFLGSLILGCLYQSLSHCPPCPAQSVLIHPWFLSPCITLGSPEKLQPIGYTCVCGGGVGNKIKGHIYSGSKAFWNSRVGFFLICIFYEFSKDFSYDSSFF